MMFKATISRLLALFLVLYAAMGMAVQDTEQELIYSIRKGNRRMARQTIQLRVLRPKMDGDDSKAPAMKSTKAPTMKSTKSPSSEDSSGTPLQAADDLTTRAPSMKSTKAPKTG